VKIIVPLLAALALIAGGWHEIGVHHLFAPADPYGPCPAGSHYVSFWSPGTSRFPVQAGVIHYHGWSEVATCGASLSITTG
jgi:hypothetical protein